jgi:hypothetical protein
MSFILQGKHFSHAFPWEIAALNWHSYALDGLITSAGQVLQYWTRISKQNPQGLKEHLEMFERINPVKREQLPAPKAEEEDDED